MAFEVEQLYVLCCATGLVFVVKGERGGGQMKNQDWFQGTRNITRLPETCEICFTSHVTCVYNLHISFTVIIFLYLSYIF